MKIKPQRNSGKGGARKTLTDGDNGNPPNRGAIAVGVLRSTGEHIVVLKR